MGSHNKPIIEQTGVDVSATEPKFDKQAFESAVYEQGYNVLLEKALQCPCRIKSNNNALSNCANCGGSGWIFINKRSTRMVLQSMNTSVKYKEWTETNAGTVSITARDDDKLAFMDRITNLDLESTHSEVLKFKNLEGIYQAVCHYQPNEIEVAQLFIDENTKLQELTKDTDYAVNGIVITLSAAISQQVVKGNEFSMTIRYYHYPQFHVIDIPRERSANRDATTGSDNCHPAPPSTEKGNISGIPQLPIHAIARRAHESIDKPELDGTELFDNSVTSTIEPVTHCDSVNSKLSEYDKLSCVLPTLDFSKSNVYASLSAQQKNDISTQQGENSTLFFGFTATSGNLNIYTITSDTKGTYSNANFIGNVVSASYRLDKLDGNGLQPVVLPFFTNIGYILEVTVTRPSSDLGDGVELLT